VKILITERASGTAIEVRPIVKRWSKKLPASDAQQVEGTTSPTGKLRLTKAGHDIDITTWFRKAFFRDADWIRKVKAGKPYEVARIPFCVRLLDRDIGEQILMVDHAPHRIAGQANVPTILAWGHLLMKELKAHSYVGNYVVLEKYEDGTFGLEVKDDPPEPAFID
jgi:hypothetical protein